MKKIIILTVFIFFACWTQAQDKIYLKNNTVVSAKVLEIGVHEIKYKKFDNLNGPDFIIDKSSVAMIQFENGTHEVISDKNTVVKNEETILDILPYYKCTNNLVGLNYFDFVFKNFTLNYTRYLLDYKLAIGASFSTGFNNSSYNGNTFLYFDRDYFHGVLSVNFLPVGMQKVTYFTGLSLMAGKGQDRYYIYPYTEDYFTKNYYGFYVNNGVQFNLTKHFNLRSSLALGLVDRNMNGNFDVHALFEFTAGIRF